MGAALLSSQPAHYHHRMNLRLQLLGLPSRLDLQGRPHKLESILVDSVWGTKMSTEIGLSAFAVSQVITQTGNPDP